MTVWWGWRTRRAPKIPFDVEVRFTVLAEDEECALDAVSESIERVEAVEWSLMVVREAERDGLGE